MTSREELYVLQKSKSGLRLNEGIEELCEELTAAGLLQEKRAWFGGKKLCLTESGKRELLKASHSTDKVARAIADGLFSHLPFPLFQQLVSSSEVERYIESQQDVQQLMLMNHLMRPRG